MALLGLGAGKKTTKAGAAGAIEIVEGGCGGRRLPRIAAAGGDAAALPPLRVLSLSATGRTDGKRVFRLEDGVLDLGIGAEPTGRTMITPVPLHPQIDQ